MTLTPLSETCVKRLAHPAHDFDSQANAILDGSTPAIGAAVSAWTQK
ncbi:unnamed protein product (plasmid) [Mycetohabitans rhizoxinica HKI 454]|uniref:Uncharacterized protein n=1 Tax=Mycetohabitans rhizoxinica (strain DSM 19002 / CIP 109453 / HKI 454) TaxID=882378 RepID=E5AUL6_MYCRK|nr:unnamed protein product [Mycetohabitans rhizoxinica HKI 454]